LVVLGVQVVLDIYVEAANALYWDLAIPRNRVLVEVDGGLVTLRGVVERSYQRSCAEEDVRRVPGVIGVTNEITVGAA
jgi:osmotically-inducible protein OsmY